MSCELLDGLQQWTWDGVGMSGGGWDKRGDWISFLMGLLSFLEDGATVKGLNITRFDFIALKR